MRSLAALGLLLALLPTSGKAVCVVEPLEPQLRAADTVYVGTIVRSELVQTVRSLRAAKRPQERLVEIRHTLEPEFTLKGRPGRAPTVISTWQYNNPLSRSVVEFAERSVLMPGDTLLVVASAGQLAQHGLCTTTREWSAATSKVVYAVFPPAP